MREEGELPEGWRSIRVGDAFKFWGGATPSTSNRSHWGGSIPWISSKDVKKSRLSSGTEFVSKKAVSEKRLRLCPSGSVLVVVRSGVLAHTLPVAVLESEAVINQDLKAFDSGDRSLNEWLALFLHRRAAEILSANRKDGTTVQSVSLAALEALRLPLPPETERARISARVESLFAAADAARSRLARVPSALTRFRQAVLAAARNGGLTGHSTLEWTERSLGDVFSVQTGGTPLRSRREYFDGGSIPWIKTGQVQNGDIHAAEEFITPRAVTDTNAKIFPAGTILIAMYGEGRTRGQVARLRIPAATNQACAALVNHGLPEETVQFVYWFLRSRYEAMRNVSVGGNQPNLSLGLIKSWPVSLPPLNVQREIVRRVESLFAIADAIEKRVAAASARADKLTQAILAKAFRGELVPTEAELNRRREVAAATPPPADRPAAARPAPRRSR
ncbi:MAG TPA: restriction endonuclease subunit S [Thermoanaerobaculia bacterium]|nr:restriction endonuclease subunit S [Thermoanaerobaculia bacterium]